MTISGFVEYVKQIWKNKPDRTTPITAAALTHIEEGVKGNSDAINKIAQAVVDNIVNDPQKIASMAALYAVNESVKKNATAIETVNNNLSNPDRINLNVLTEITSLNSPERTGVYYVTGNNIGALPPGLSNYGILLCMRSPYSLHPTNSNCVYVQEYTDVYGKHASRSFNNGAWTNWVTTATKDDLDSKLELVTTDYLPLTAATINPNSYTNFIFNPSLPSGYILVGACLKDTRQLAQKVAPLYCSASTSNGTHRINFRLANTSDDPVSITESMGVAFYLFVRKR